MHVANMQHEIRLEGRADVGAGAEGPLGDVVAILNLRAFKAAACVADEQDAIRTLLGQRHRLAIQRHCSRAFGDRQRAGADRIVFTGRGAFGHGGGGAVYNGGGTSRRISDRARLDAAGNILHPTIEITRLSA